MLALAVKWRQDLRGIRQLVAAAGADVGSTVWGGLGPNLNASSNQVATETLEIVHAGLQVQGV